MGRYLLPSLERILFEVPGDHVARLICDDGSLAAFDVICRDHTDTLEADLRALPGIVLRNLFGSLKCQDDDRDIRFLGDLKYTVMEREKFAGLASGAFRIYRDGDLISDQKLGGTVDGHHGVPRVFAVDGHEAASSDQTAVEGDLEVRFLGDERGVVLTKKSPGDKRVEVGSVVADEEHLLAFRDLVEIDEVVADAHDPHTDAGRGVKKEAVKPGIFVVFFLRADEKRGNEDKKKIDNDGCDERTQKS